MDVLPRVLRQLMGLFREMSSVQRMMSIAAVCVVSIAFAWLVLKNQSADFQPVAYGKAFLPDELASVEHALASAGLTGFRREGQRLLVSGKDLDKYNAALLELDAMPTDLGSQMLKQFESLGPFSTDRQRQQMKEALLLQELGRMIKTVPDVEDARVVIASSERRTGWNQKQRTTANVSVKPRSGRELSPTLVNSLRHVVANMVPDLAPTDVTVFDTTRGQAFIGETANDSTDSQYLQRAREFTRQYEQQIQKALSYIPNVNVTAHVDMDSLKSSTVRSEKVRLRSNDGQVANRPTTLEVSDPGTKEAGDNSHPTETLREVTEKQLVAAIPKAVQVSVSIPRDYLRDLAARRKARGETAADQLDLSMIEDEELAKAERIIGHLIFAGSSSSSAVTVTCVDPAPSDLFSAKVEQITEPLWIPTVPLLAGFAIGCLVLVMVWGAQRTTTHQMNDESIGLGVEIQNQATTATIATAAGQDRISVLRDEIRLMVETDPAATAVLLSKWLAGGAS